MVAAKKRERVVAMKPKWLAEAKSLEGDAKEYMWKDWRNQGKSDKPKPAKTITKSSAKPKTKADAKAEDKAKTKADAKATDDSKTSAKRKTKAGPKAKDKTRTKADAKATDDSKTSAKRKTKAGPKAKEKARTKADAKAKDKPKTPDKPKKTAAEPKTSVEPLTEYDVWVDDSDLIYDAYLTQTSSVTNRDRVYRIQVRKDPESSTFKTRTKWGGVGKTPMYQVLGNGGHEEAVKIFKERFKSKTGLDWENRLADPIPKNYTYDRHYGGDDGATDHS
ncbi:hypothetical protein BFJ66_g15159 [Fusarium oxysporum f. sp. cepae]|uniref:NAD(+) ADP-ribosyltransferase n=1 Tax=Fusarium oxysporum f. sp. cepae TaxID=396571 RepID=A0A3L6N1P7_FUSOX|nr:hypothetical protein BFJ65_g14507 [Fusarium oxysporum f. sp. cepae]RKK31612.1 hypothetical protein BFJ67_g15154 [Fusarium oxysporum f. sp. cepae]RKK32892.1 hypothetical protein BFJ66_g15159 [Fusarium oxysporum f. sp. cepae]